MFEHSLAGTVLPERSFRFGPVSAALVIHAGVLLAVVMVSVLTLRPPKGPTPPLTFVFPIRPPELDSGQSGGSAPRPAERPRNETAPAQPVRPTPPEPVPDVVRDLEPATPVDNTVTQLDGDESSGQGGDASGNGTGDGSGLGSGSGSGSGDGPEGEGNGTGNGSDPIEVGPGVTSPRLIVKVQPVYPTIARRSRTEGEVVLRAVVGPDGTVTRVEVVRSTSPMFNDAALDAVRRWRYTPPSQGGRPVSVWLDVVVKFTLR